MIKHHIDQLSGPYPLAPANAQKALDIIPTQKRRYIYVVLSFVEYVARTIANIDTLEMTLLDGAPMIGPQDKCDVAGLSFRWDAQSPDALFIQPSLSAQTFKVLEATSADGLTTANENTLIVEMNTPPPFQALEPCIVATLSQKLP